MTTQVSLNLLPSFGFKLLSVNLLFALQGQQAAPLHLGQLLLQLGALLRRLRRLPFSIRTHPSGIAWTDASNIFQNPTQ